jgi:MoaA/NifB/PqqE/SkfB family radical SAM enzyme
MKRKPGQRTMDMTMKEETPAGAAPSRPHPSTYESDFFERAYAPWLAEHPEHLPAALSLGASLQDGFDLRQQLADRYGAEIPETLVISLTWSCNRRCAFCAASEFVTGPPRHLEPALLRSALDQCRRLGTRRIALVGGEPLLYPGVDELVADNPDFFFSLFTNGLLLDEKRVRRFESLANLALIVNVSAVGGCGAVDRMSPEGLDALARLKRRGLFFGFVATVHRDNHQLFRRRETLDLLMDLRVRFGVLFDYLPNFGPLAHADPLRLAPELRREVVRQAREAAASRSMLLICAPEDEGMMGGCGAAGRMVVHLSAHGTITPCPLVLYSKFDFRKHTLLHALQSDYFHELRTRSHDWEKLEGSCAFRAAEGEFQTVNRRHGVKRDEPAPAVISRYAAGQP